MKEAGLDFDGSRRPSQIQGTVAADGLIVMTTYVVNQSIILVDLEGLLVSIG